MLVTSLLFPGKSEMCNIPQLHRFWKNMLLSDRRPPPILHSTYSDLRAHIIRGAIHLCAHIGVVSPELNNARPRARNMSVWGATLTGVDDGFVGLGTQGLGVGLHGELNEPEHGSAAISTLFFVSLRPLDLHSRDTGERDAG
jgi:hypothetical protein